jgi:hypothetical protein
MDHQSSRYAEPNAAEPNANSYGYGDCHTDSHSDGYTDGDRHCHCYSHCYSDSDGYTYGNGYTHTDLYSKTYTYAKAHPATKNSANSAAAPVAGGDWRKMSEGAKHRRKEPRSSSPLTKRADWKPPVLASSSNARLLEESSLLVP